MAEAKICGLTTPETVDAALRGGAAYLGFVFFSKSPRNIALNVAADLAAPARGHAGIVALVVDCDDDVIDEIVQQVGPDILQLHGHESPKRTAQIKARFERKVWKAIAVATADDVGAAVPYGDAADSVLFDARPPPGSASLPGGNGLTFDWRILEGEAAKRKFVLAGGLTPDNVAAAVKLTGASVVDVSSGVESAPGLKDPGLIRHFLQEVERTKQNA